jgi:hypothetical protein
VKNRQHTPLKKKGTLETHKHYSRSVRDEILGDERGKSESKPRKRKT